MLQHAYNPVDWFPWGDEAFKKSKNEDKLIFLSIGYSTCHWCHKMAHDAFSDETTADYLNKNFVSIKVDREERPDIDEVYMLACQLLSGNCGWPLNIVMSPDKKPVFAATYLPSQEKYGSRSLVSILEDINRIWLNDRKQVFNLGNLITSRINILQKDTNKEEINETTIKNAYNQLIRNFDKEYGGFGPSPKFPTPHNLSFLLRWHKQTGKKAALDMVNFTLNSMYSGGIFDHVGGGFHRYSTDRMWMVPHFEKMLYDQALIVSAYTEAYQVTGNEFYADVAKKTLGFVLNELTSPEGAFYSGIDADTEGQEGKFYVWGKDEISEILKEDADLFCQFYGVTESGNFESGKNVLYIPMNQNNFTKKLNLNLEETKNRIDLCLKKLYEARNKRTYPHVDDKIIVSWNGLMIRAFALAGRAFNEDKYKIAAKKAAKFIKENLISADNNIFRSYREEKSNVTGFLEDYAYLIHGYLELYEATFDIHFLKTAKSLTDKMIENFYDESEGGFYLTSKDAETPLTRIKEAADYTIPSGNSVAALILLILGDITENSYYTDLAYKTFECFGYKANQFPTSYTALLSALIYSIGRHRLFLISENPDDKDTGKIIQALNRQLFQDSVTLYKPKNDATIEEIYPSAKGKQAFDHQTEIYICEKTACNPPLKGLHAVNAYLDKENQIE